ncbi:hypothetical protein Fmac_018135 [Flemingia macrophylla]|uniref:Protein FATTY ACID EXPORT 3, chloroplastic n=1 Tax=Flemingia macrophylla TaxID=520843 RepID=A0ABD1M452_9FABA
MAFSIDSVSVLNPKLSDFYIPFNRCPHSLIFHPLLKPRPLNALTLALHRRKSLTLASQQDSVEHGDVEVEKEEELHAGAEESQRAWKQALETVREQAAKFQGVSQEAYALYSRKAIVILKDSTEQLKVLADKTSHELGVAAKEITEEGKGYLSAATQNSPDVKEIVEAFTSPSQDIHKFSGVRDFYVGVPYGLLLSLGGFLSFVVTGNIAAIRFGVILGGALLTLSILSLKSYKRGHSSPLALKGQAAIASILFLREMSSLGKGSFSFTTFISGAVAVFYVYRILLERNQQKGSNLENESGN